MAKITAKCHKLLEAEILRRSSHIISVAGSHAYVFGGELKPREPRDNDVHAIALSNTDKATKSKCVTSKCPSPRVGTAAATLNGKIYIFSGRGGVEMAPIEENGAIWEFDPAAAQWSILSTSQSDYNKIPASRSYHCMASDGKDTLYLHAGCPEKGRLGDLWSFSVSRKEWTELAAAFDPPRGGTSIAFIDGALYRMNGFDGKAEQGGNLDIYSPGANSWASHTYLPDGIEGPTPRSVSAVLPLRLGGRSFLVTLFGERDPSSLGHQGAGKMLGDVWAFDMEKKIWQQVSLDGEAPQPRGWFDADVVNDNTVVLNGGLGESNERLGDVWSLDFVYTD